MCQPVSNVCGIHVQLTGNILMGNELAVHFDLQVLACRINKSCKYKPVILTGLCFGSLGNAIGHCAASPLLLLLGDSLEMKLD